MYSRVRTLRRSQLEIISIRVDIAVVLASSSAISAIVIRRISGSKNGWPTFSRQMILDIIEWPISSRRLQLVSICASLRNTRISQMATPKGLDEQQQELVRKLAAENNSAAMIAKELGVTRNKVLGWCHRNGIKLSFIRVPVEERATKKPRPRMGPAKSINPLPPRPIEVPLAEANGNEIHFNDMEEHHCRMPLWTGVNRTGMVCGNRRSEMVYGRVRSFTSYYCRECLKLTLPVN